MVIRHSEYKPLSVPRNEVLVSTPIVSIVQAWDHRVRSSRHQPWRTKFSSVTRTWKQRKRWLGHVRPVNRPQMALFQLFFFSDWWIILQKMWTFFFSLASHLQMGDLLGFHRHFCDNRSNFGTKNISASSLMLSLLSSIFAHCQKVASPKREKQTLKDTSLLSYFSY